MTRFYGNALLCAALVWFGAALPASAQSASNCDPVIYHSADPNCWGQYSGHADFTTEFDVRVDRAWVEALGEVPGFTMLFNDVTRQDTGQRLLLKCGWWSESTMTEAKCYELQVGETYRVRAGRGYGYVYERQPIDGVMTWLETSCDLDGGPYCLP